MVFPKQGDEIPFRRSIGEREGSFFHRSSKAGRQGEGKISIRTVSTLDCARPSFLLFFPRRFFQYLCRWSSRLSERAQVNHVRRKKTFFVCKKIISRTSSSSIHRRSDIHLRIAVLPIFVSTATFASDDDPDSPANSPELVLVVVSAEASSETRLMTNVSSVESDR